MDFLYGPRKRISASLGFQLQIPPSLGFRTEKFRIILVISKLCGHYTLNKERRKKRTAKIAANAQSKPEASSWEISEGQVHSHYEPLPNCQYESGHSNPFMQPRSRVEELPVAQYLDPKPGHPYEWRQPSTRHSTTDGVQYIKELQPSPNPKNSRQIILEWLSKVFAHPSNRVPVPGILG